MAVPLMRSYTTDGSALNVFGLATDDITGLTITQLNRSNVILDSVSNPQPTGGETYEDRLLINGLQAGVTFFLKHPILAAPVELSLVQFQ